MKRTAITYLNYVINPVIGCTPVSEGCGRCYAAAWANRCGRDFSQVKTDVKKMLGMAKLKFGTDNLRRGACNKPLVGVCFLSDLFHPAVPADFIVSAFECMAYRKDVDWVVLTKRPERMVSVLFGEEGNWYLGGGDFYDHIWLGVTAENQMRADERIPILLNNWAGPKFVSVEPMLEAMDLTQYLMCQEYEGPLKEPIKGTIGGKAYPTLRYRQGLSWLIVGSESGNNRRPFRIEWAKSLVEQCRQANIPIYCKQDSGLYPGVPLLIDGKVIHEFPESRKP